MKNIILYMNQEEMALLIAGLERLLELQNHTIKYNDEVTEELKLKASIVAEDIKILQGEFISAKRTAIAQNVIENENKQEEITNNHIQ